MSGTRSRIINLIALITACIILSGCNDDLDTLEQVSEPVPYEKPHTYMIFQTDLAQMGWHTLAVASGKNKGGWKYYHLSPGRFDVTPVFSYDKRWIAYARLAGGESNYRIWKMRNDGEGKIPLTPPEKNCQRPRFSRDGKWIVFELTQGSRTDICMIDSAGGNWRQLTDASTITFYSTASFGSPDFSPDGKWIVFSYTRGGMAKRGIGVLDLMTNQFTPYTSTEEYSADSPRWSPNTNEIAFTGYLAGEGGPKLFIISSTGTASIRTLTTTAWGVYSPDWSNDGGSDIAFAGKDSLKGYSSIWRIDHTGINEIKEFEFLNVNCTEPSW